ncbi:class I SAM-dependent methyltransferase [Rhodoferax sp.]|uniref:class I SAM-dependent methyltransferase n=1 Tax=Rhodoferax sp. TaxID=50421 RepID=UPI00260E5353|nr:class I SAM-dependent methyltransferase [Rhodoferax sp.]MDD2926897.1 class I SAM-dependent methyltransferase [Rhodoferax sp.]
MKKQYEALPYPARDPQDDHKRLVQTWLEDLPMINHYCFAGKQSFQNHFRALVAGAGTGDATIFLAEQLRHTNAQVVHLDMSEASIAIARQRAEIRQLTNITWVHDSLLNLPSLAVGPFDYINCSGVLHHLADPDLGFKALQSVLKDDGAIGLMVYASIGRTGVYQMQSLMRMVNSSTGNEPLDTQDKIANTQDLLASLPASNWFNRGQDLYHDHKVGDSGIYDLLLHSQDRAYAVGELFDWLGKPLDGAENGHGFHLAFTDTQRGRSPYLPHMVLGRKPPQMAAKLRQLSRRKQYEMAELMIGNITSHVLYLTRDASCTAPYGDAAYIPFFFHEPLTGDILANVFGNSRGAPFRLEHQHSGVSLMVNPGKYAAPILRLVDGRRSFAEIFDQFRANWTGKTTAPDNATLFNDFAESFDVLNALDRLLLKHPDAGATVSPG